MEASQKHLAGVLLIAASAAFFSVAGVMIKMVSVDAWTIAGWRGLVGGLLLGAYYLWRRRRDGATSSLWLDRRGWFLAVISVLASLMFIASLKNTYVANVAVIYATAPFMAAGLARLVLGERVGVRTLLTACASLAGVMMIVAGSLGSANVSGDALALGMTALFAVYIVATRAFPQTPVLWAVAISALALFAISWMVVDPLAISTRDMAVCIAFGGTFAVAVALLTEGARLLPVAETALVGTLDVPLAVAFAWLLVDERPPLDSMIGGAVVLAAIVIHSIVETMQDRGRRRGALCGD